MVVRNCFWGRGGSLVVEILARLGIEHIFSIPGAQTLSIWDGLYKRNDISLIGPASEWAGAYTAMRYGSEVGRLAVVLNTVGPGCVNEMPAMAAAKRNRIPVLFVTPSQPAFKKEVIDTTFQGLRQAEILAPFCDMRYEITKVTPNWSSIIKHVVDRIRRGEIACVRLEIEFPLLFQIRRERLLAQ